MPSIDKEKVCPKCKKLHENHDESCGFKHVLHGVEGNGFYTWQPVSEEAFAFSEMKRKTTRSKS